MQVYKFAKRLKKKACPFYDKLCTIFDDTTDIGSNAHSQVNGPSDDKEEYSKQTKSFNKKHDYLDEYDDNSRNSSHSFEKYEKRSCLSKLSLDSKKKMDLTERVVTSSAPTPHDGVSTGAYFHLLNESVSV